MDIVSESDKHLNLVNRQNPEEQILLQDMYTLLLNKETGEWVNSLVTIEKVKNREKPSSTYGKFFFSDKEWEYEEN